MNKRRPGEPVLRGGLASEEATARAINAEPWDPLSGMVKAQCPECRCFFVAPVATTTLCVRTAPAWGRGRWCDQPKPPGSGVIYPRA
jgi:hypothetical protein